MSLLSTSSLISLIISLISLLLVFFPSSIIAKSSSPLSIYKPSDQSIILKQHQYYFRLFDQLSFQSTHIDANTINQNNSTIASLPSIASQYGYVSIWPLKSSNGGYGNVVYHFVEVIGISFVLAKPAIMDNEIMKLLFQHPLAQHGLTWNILPYDQIRGDASRPQGNSYNRLTPCGHVATHRLSTWSKQLFVQGCYGNNLQHPEIKDKWARLLNVDANRPDFIDFLQSLLFLWTYSNPMPAFQEHFVTKFANMIELFNKKAKEKQGQTSMAANQALDLVVHARTFKDNSDANEELYITNKLAHFKSCLLPAALAAQQRRAKDQDKDIAAAPINVFIVSDSDKVSRMLMDYLYGTKEFTGTVLTGSDLSDREANRDWLSINLMTDHAKRKGENDTIIHRQDLLEWMIVRSALASISSEDSTFSKSARLTTGYLHRRHDVFVSYQNAFDCSPAVPMNLVCKTCKDIGQDQCPVDVQADCQAVVV